MGQIAKRAAERIWAKYERRIGQMPARAAVDPISGQERPGTAGGLDKDSFILTVTDIIDASISEAVYATLGEALNSGDGSYKP